RCGMTRSTLPGSQGSDFGAARRPPRPHSAESIGRRGAPKVRPHSTRSPPDRPAGPRPPRGYLPDFGMTFLPPRGWHAGQKCDGRFRRPGRYVLVIGPEQDGHGCPPRPYIAFLARNPPSRPSTVRYPSSKLDPSAAIASVRTEPMAAWMRPT